MCSAVVIGSFAVSCDLRDLKYTKYVCIPQITPYNKISRFRLAAPTFRAYPVGHFFDCPFFGIILDSFILYFQREVFSQKKVEDRRHTSCISNSSKRTYAKKDPLMIAKCFQREIFPQKKVEERRHTLCISNSSKRIYEKNPLMIAKCFQREVFSQKKVEECRHTLCISNSSKRTYAKKDPLKWERSV